MSTTATPAFDNVDVDALLRVCTYMGDDPDPAVAAVVGHVNGIMLRLALLVPADDRDPQTAELAEIAEGCV